MREVTVTANLVATEKLDSADSVTATLPRRELEAASHGGDPLELWFDIADENDEESMRLTVEVPSADIRKTLRLSTGDDLVLALDGHSIAELYDDPRDVEAHGMRGALAIAVTAGAIAAPASLAAGPQVAGTASKPQVTRADVKPQVARTALKPDLVRTALKPQVARTALKTQVANRDVTRQVVRLVVRAAGVNTWR